MKLRIKKRWNTPRQLTDNSYAGTKTPAKDTAKTEHPICAAQDALAQHPDSANPRTIGNPYGRLFTADRKFSELLTKKQPQKPHKTPTTQNHTTTADRATNTVLTAPEKQAK